MLYSSGTKNRVKYLKNNGLFRRAAHKHERIPVSHDDHVKLASHRLDEIALRPRAIPFQELAGHRHRATERLAIALNVLLEHCTK